MDGYIQFHNNQDVIDNYDYTFTAFEEAEKNAPAIIFIDELDAIAPKRDKVGMIALQQNCYGCCNIVNVLFLRL